MSHLDLSFLEHLRDNPMIRFVEKEIDGVKVVMPLHMIGDKELWDDPWARETRGSVFDPETGECISAAFPKFFNVGEREETQPHLIKDRVLYVLDKVDGSIITPVVINGKVYLKSKKSFDSEVAQMANAAMTPDLEKFCKDMIELGKATPIFEFTCPDNQVVIDYGPEAKFTLLAIRGNYTGAYVDWNALLEIASVFDFDVPKRFFYGWDELVDHIENDKGNEGFVLWLADGTMVKYKTKWYLSLHGTVTNLTEKDVVEAVLNETVDDLKSQLSTLEDCDISVIEEIETRVVEEMNEIRRQVDHIVAIEKLADKEVKDVAIQYKGHPLFGCIMSAFRGREPDVRRVWKSNNLASVPNTSVYRPTFSRR